MNSKALKKAALEAGADLVGIASMDRFEGAPKQMDPRYIFPDAKALIALAFRIHRGCFRGIEEGTYFISYATMGYAHINQVQIPTTLRKTCSFLEDHGWEAVPIPMESHFAAISDCNGKLNTQARAVSADKPVPDVMIHFRIAAVAAGLGEIGYSNLLLTPEFGPMQRVAFILTDAPLKPDPLFNGQLCDHCLMCARTCSGRAISEKETVEMTIAGRTYKMGKLNQPACSLAYAGGVHETSPFLPPDTKFDLSQESAGRPGDGRPELREKLPFAEATLSTFHHWPPIEGARGCMRECLAHLEKQGKLKKKFHAPFHRGKKPWKMNSTPADQPSKNSLSSPHEHSHY